MLLRLFTAFAVKAGVSSLIGILLTLASSHKSDRLAQHGAAARATTVQAPDTWRATFQVRRSTFGPARSAAEVVTNKVAQFARSRREILHALAGRFKVQVPADLDRFFDLAEAGRWEDLKSLFESLQEQRRNR
jgi:hypothetical protein